MHLYSTSKPPTHGDRHGSFHACATPAGRILALEETIESLYAMQDKLQGLRARDAERRSETEEQRESARQQLKHAMLHPSDTSDGHVSDELNGQNNGRAPIAAHSPRGAGPHASAAAAPAGTRAPPPTPGTPAGGIGVVISGVDHLMHKVRRQREKEAERAMPTPPRPPIHSQEALALRQKALALSMSSKTS